MYTPQRTSTPMDLPIRGMTYRVRTWGKPNTQTAPLVLAHGWMDVGASYQFVVDAFSEAFVSNRFIIAPDWRGFGNSRPAVPCDHYSFVDYLGDLDALLHHFAPNDQAVDLVGHSMGGNISMLYAGARPARIRRLVNLEGFGMPATQPDQAPARTAQWLDQLRQLHSGEIRLSTYDSQQAVAQRLQKTNLRLPLDKALWLAGEWAAPTADGRWAILGDAAHKVVNPQLFRVEEVLAAYAAITAPLLAVEASDDTLSSWTQGSYDLPQYHARLQAVPRYQIAQVQDAGHMLHHDQPQAVARLIEDFLASAIS